MAKRHSFIAFAVRILAVVVSLNVLGATVPDLGRWWRVLIAVLIALLVGFATERVLQQHRSSAGAELRPPR